MTFELDYLTELEFEKPIMVAGLPGIANVGKLAIEFLINELETEKFAELYSDYFPGWVVRDNGLVEGLRVDFYKGELDGFDQDFILVTADAQASSSLGQYKLSRRIVEIATEHEVDKVFTLAAFLAPGEDRAPVIGAATDSETAELIVGEEVELLDGGKIVGMNGLLLSLAHDKGINGACLLGTTSGGTVDGNASRNVLSELARILEFELDLSDFEDRVPELPKFKPPKMKTPSIPSGDEDVSYIR
ncbi:MAG: PAC2 family protein [Hadesarchaea archaeon]|nr:PAC2 family protein [Hadesarchaea archaeon]